MLKCSLGITSAKIQAQISQHLNASIESLRAHPVSYIVFVQGELADFQMRMAALAITLLPAAFIMLYSSIATRTSPIIRVHDAAISRMTSDDVAPIASLLHLTLLTSALPLYLLSPSAHIGDTSGIFATLPISLMLSIRGEGEGWDVAVLASNLMMFR